MTVTVNGTATGSVWSADIAEQVEILRQRTERLGTELREARADYRGQISALRAHVDAEQSARASEIAAIRKAHTAAQREATEIDARGVPLLAYGILLTSWPDRFMPVWFAWTLLGSAAVVVAQAVPYVRRTRRHVHRPSSSAT